MSTRACRAINSIFVPPAPSDRAHFTGSRVPFDSAMAQIKLRNALGLFDPEEMSFG